MTRFKICAGTSLLAASFLFNLLAFAAEPNPPVHATAEPFFKRFEIVKNAQGEPDMILVKGDARNSLVEPFLAEVADEVAFAQAQGANAMDESFTATWAPDELQDWPEKDRETARQGLQEVQNIDIQDAYKDAKFKDTMAWLEKKLKQHLVGYRVLSNLNDPRYFYSRSVARKLVTVIVSQVKKRMKDSPYLNVAQFIANKLSDYVEGRRVFHQYMLLHYLDKFKPQDLGLTQEEVMKAKSSIYESKIPWIAFWASNSAKSHWLYYGNLYFSHYYDAASLTLYENRKNYSEISERADFAFSVVTEKGHKKVVNLLDHQFIGSSKPSAAYYYDNPHKVKMQRTMLQLMELGIGFIPNKHWAIWLAKEAATNFIDSMYVSQMKTEGALLGYFESVGDNDAAKVIRGQTVDIGLLAEETTAP